MAGIASIPDRVLSLEKTIESLHKQVDVIAIVLNNYTEIPPFLSKYSNVYAQLGDNSKGDAEKFRFIGNVGKWFLTCDDDLVYPDGYCEDMIAKSELYNCPVSLAGKNFKFPVASYHRSAIDFYHCLRGFEGDHEVQIAGTGVLCFHTDMIKVSIDDFKTKNMADVYFAKLAKEQGVKLMAIGHEGYYLKYNHHKWNIWSSKGDRQEETIMINEILRPK